LERAGKPKDAIFGLLHLLGIARAALLRVQTPNECLGTERGKRQWTHPRTSWCPLFQATGASSKRSDENCRSSKYHLDEYCAIPKVSHTKTINNEQSTINIEGIILLKKGEDFGTFSEMVKYS